MNASNNDYWVHGEGREDRGAGAAVPGVDDAAEGPSHEGVRTDHEEGRESQREGRLGAGSRTFPERKLGGICDNIICNNSFFALWAPLVPSRDHFCDSGNYQI